MTELEIAFGAPLPSPPARIWPWPPAESVIPLVVDMIVSRFQPLRVILFGSRARGNPRKSSDVDILIVMPSVEDKRALTAEIRQAIVYLPLATDIVVTTPDEIQQYGDIPGLVLYAALREGKMLYDSGS